MPRLAHRRSLLWFVSVLLLFIVVVTAGTVYTLQRLRTEAVNKYFELAAMHARLFENYLTHNLTLIRLTLGHALELDTQALSTEQITRQLHEMLRYTPAIRSLSLLDAQGRIIASSHSRNLGITPLPDSQDLLPPASNTQTLLRLSRIWTGRDFYSGHSTSKQQPAAPTRRIFLPVLLEPVNTDAPRALAALNPDFMLNYFLANIPPEQGIVDVLRYDGSLLFSTDLRQSPGTDYRLPTDIDLSHEEFGFLANNYYQADSIGAFRASRHFPLLILVFFEPNQVLAAWQQEAKSIASMVGFSLLLVVLVSLGAYYFLRRAALREQEAQRQMRLAAKVYAESEEGIIVVDERQHVLLINPAFTRITGYALTDLQHLSLPRLFTPIGEPERSRALWRSIRQRGYWNGDICNRHKNGQAIRLSLKLSQLSVKAGEHMRYVAIFADMTEQKRAEAQLRQLSLAVEQSPSSVVITDLKANIEYVNQAFCNITGYNEKEILGHNPRVLNSGLTPQETYAAMWQKLTSGQAWEGDFFNRRKDGSHYIEHALIAPVFNEGRATHYVAVKHDITEMRRLTENLQHAKEAAETANRVKDAFIANMSHELRTPLNIILGFAHILQEAQDIPQHHQDEAARIYHSGEQLLGLISDVLELTKMAASQIELFTQETEIKVLLQEIVDLFRFRAAAKSLRFEYHTPTPLPHSLHTDPKRLRQALTNILSNAIKFTEQGYVRLVVDYADKHLQIQVEDTGIGIAPEQQDIVFQAFSKVSEHYQQGSGLGLTMARNIIELMGGDITLKSQIGQGSCFTLRIPLSIVRQKPPATALNPAFPTVPKASPNPSTTARSENKASENKPSENKLDERQRAELLAFLEDGAMTELIDYLHQLNQRPDCPSITAELLNLAESFQLDEIQQRLEQG